MTRLSVALYARASAAEQETVEQILGGLAAYAAGRGWEVALECADQGPFPEGRRDGLRRLLGAVRAKAVQAVVVRSLSHLARSLRHLDDEARARALAARGGLRRGGRPATPLDDTDLAAAWRNASSLSALARNLGVSRHRVRSLRPPLGGYLDWRKRTTMTRTIERHKNVG